MGIRNVSHQCVKRYFATTSSRRIESEDDFKRVPQAPRRFPTFFTPEKPELIVKPNLLVLFNTLLEGKPHVKEVYENYVQNTDQSTKDLYQGAVFAASVATKAISEQDHAVLSNILTPEAAEYLTHVMANYEEIKSDADLISIPEEDILMSWIHDVKEGSDGKFRAVLVAISFPSFGMMTRKISDNKSLQTSFTKSVVVPPDLDKAQVKEHVQKQIMALHESLFDCKPFFNFNPLVVSNFHLVRQDDTWLIEKIYMAHAKDFMTPYGHFKWKGRISFAVRRGTTSSFMPIYRMDIATDILGVSTFFFMVILILSGQMG